MNRPNWSSRATVEIRTRGVFGERAEETPRLEAPVSEITRDAVLQALWAWDPIGIAAHREEVGSEYDKLASQILIGVGRGAPYAELAITVCRYVDDLGVQAPGQDRFLNWLRSATAMTDRALPLARSVSDESILRLREVALDGNVSAESRKAAVEALAELGTAGAVDALLELGGRQDESDAILRAAGRALARLTDHGLVSQWDVRDLAEAAGDAFYE
jgi:hypothetical protein